MANLVGLWAQNLPWLDPSSHRLSRHGAQHRLHHETSSTPPLLPLNPSAARPPARDTVLDHPMKIPTARSGRRCWRRTGALDGAGRLAGWVLVFKTPRQLSVLLLPLECQTWDICTFGRENAKDSRSAFWSHAVLAVLANPSPVARSVAPSGTV